MFGHAKAFAEKIGLRFPVIIQAPMAGGITTPELVASVSNAGGLGSFATGYLSPTQVSEGIKQIKQLTQRPFQVNLFIPNEIVLDPSVFSAYQTKLNEYRRELNLLEEEPSQPPQLQPDYLHEIIDILLSENIRIVSFTFGMLEPLLIKQLKDAGVYLIGTANTIKDAILLEQSGIDAIVAQGREAGGHQGGFTETVEAPLATHDLVSALLPYLHIPIIASGGIMTAENIFAMLQQNVVAVQMGTAFLPMKESGTHPVYRAALLEAASMPSETRDELTVMTTAYSGKPARGLWTRFIREVMGTTPIPCYPIPHYLTKGIRVEAAKQGNRELMSLWCGKNITQLDPTQDSVELLLNALWDKLTSYIDQKDEEATHGSSTSSSFSCSYSSH